MVKNIVYYSLANCTTNGYLDNFNVCWKGCKMEYEQNSLYTAVKDCYEILCYVWEQRIEKILIGILFLVLMLVY
jgi:hypothetical protein